MNAILYLCLCSLTFALCAEDETLQIKRWTELFRPRLIDSMGNPYLEFDTHVPIENRVEILCKVWEADHTQESDNTKLGILSYLVMAKLKSPWEETPLEPFVFSCISSHDESLRVSAFKLIMRAKIGQERRRTIALVCLGDSVDRIRAQAVSATGKLEDGKEILAAYVRMHASDPAYSKSIYAAKYILDPPPRKNVQK